MTSEHHVWECHGVLHPQHESRVSPFGYMDNFCGVLREVGPHGLLPIVISSSWRVLFPVEELRAHFPGDIAARIAGITPFLLPVNPDLNGAREREIMAWMVEHAPGGKGLAVDDEAMYFTTDCPHLLLVDEDFDRTQAPVDGEFALMAEIEDRERLTALWQPRGRGINLRVADKLRRRLLEFLCARARSTLNRLQPELHRLYLVPVPVGTESGVPPSTLIAQSGEGSTW